MTILTSSAADALSYRTQDGQEAEFFAAIRSQVQLSVNVTVDTVSAIRRENDTFYDGLSRGRLAPSTNGPTVQMNDVQAGTDRVVSQVAKAFYEQRAIEAEALDEEDIEAANQANKMIRHVLFNQNNGKILIRDSIKSIAKYAFGGALRLIRSEKDITEHYEMHLEAASSMDDAKRQAQLIAANNSQDGYVFWKVLKVKKETYKTPKSFEGEPVLDDKGKVFFSKEERFVAYFEVQKNIVDHKIVLIPPEEFLIDKAANDIDSCKFVAQRRLVPRSDLEVLYPGVGEILGSGTPFSVYATSYTAGFSNEKSFRRRLHNTLNITTQSTNTQPQMQDVFVTEGFIRFDWDGDGFAEWRAFAMTDNLLLYNEHWDGPLTIILGNLNRDPHRPDEVTVVERLKDSHLAKTAILRSDLRAHMARNSTQIIAKNSAFPLSGLRKLQDGTAGIIPFGENQQGQPVEVRGPIAENVMVLAKPEPSQASVAMLGYLDQMKASQIGVNNLNDVAGTHYSRSAPATNAAIQQRSQDIAVEDMIMVYGETVMKPLFKLIWWSLVQDCTHPCIKEKFIRLTGKPCIDVEKRSGQDFLRQEFVVNVGLGVDSPEYKNFKASSLLQLLMAFNQQMSGQTLPNLLPKMFFGFQEAVKALGYDPDVVLLRREEFDQYRQALLQQHQMASQQKPPVDPTIEATVRLIDAQTMVEKVRAQQLMMEMRQLQQAEIPSMVAKTQLTQAQTRKEIEETKVIPLTARAAAQAGAAKSSINT